MKILVKMKELPQFKLMINNQLKQYNNISKFDICKNEPYKRKIKNRVYKLIKLLRNMLIYKYRNLL